MPSGSASSTASYRGLVVPRVGIDPILGTATAALPGRSRRFLLSSSRAVGLVFAVGSNAALLFQGQGGPTDGFGIAVSPRTRHLVTTGLYRYTRNPMVFGTNLVYLAIVVHLGSVSGLVVLALFVSVLIPYLRWAEERRLLADFRRGVSALPPAHAAALSGVSKIGRRGRRGVGRSSDCQGFGGDNGEPERHDGGRFRRPHLCGGVKRMRNPESRPKTAEIPRHGPFCRAQQPPWRLRRERVVVWRPSLTCSWAAPANHARRRVLEDHWSRGRERTTPSGPNAEPRRSGDIAARALPASRAHAVRVRIGHRRMRARRRWLESAG